jgi:glyoxylase-like metal-dependent hydrolase (beta-lactamase superfamily II)
MNFKYILFVLAVFGIRLANAGEDLSKEIIKATPLSASIYMLEGAGGNMTASIGKDGVFLVDDDFAQMANKLVGKLKELHGGAPRFIVNTHFHYDHTGGNEIFGSTATIIAATAVRDRLMHEQTLWSTQHPAEPRQAWPTITFDDSLNIHFNDDDTRVLHLANGHTDGDSVVFFNGGKVVSMGDLYFSGMYPIFHPEHLGSLSGFVRNIEKVLSMIPEDSQIVPGHGPLATKAELKNYHKMILASISTVTKGIKAKRALVQIQKTGLPAEWESYSHGYLTTDKWIALLYRELKPVISRENQ